MNINIPRYSLFGIAGGQEVDYTFVKFVIYSLTMIALLICRCFESTLYANKELFNDQLRMSFKFLN